MVFDFFSFCFFFQFFGWSTFFRHVEGCEWQGKKLKKVCFQGNSKHWCLSNGTRVKGDVGKNVESERKAFTKWREHVCSWRRFHKSRTAVNISSLTNATCWTIRGISWPHMWCKMILFFFFSQLAEVLIFIETEWKFVNSWENYCLSWSDSKFTGGYSLFFRCSSSVEK